VPIHEFSHSYAYFIRRQLSFGGAFWNTFSELPFDTGRTFTFLPPFFPLELADRVDEALLGRFADQTSFEEEYNYLLDQIKRKTGNAAVFGLGSLRPDIPSALPGLRIVDIGTVFSEGYSKLLVASGEHLDARAIQDALCLASSPFLCGALIETGDESPTDFVAAVAGRPRVDDLVERTVGIMAEAYRGEGDLIWELLKP